MPNPYKKLSNDISVAVNELRGHLAAEKWAQYTDEKINASIKKQDNFLQDISSLNEALREKDEGVAKLEVDLKQVEQAYQKFLSQIKDALNEAKEKGTSVDQLKANLDGQIKVLEKEYAEITKKITRLETQKNVLLQKMTTAEKGLEKENEHHRDLIENATSVPSGIKQLFATIYLKCSALRRKIQAYQSKKREKSESISKQSTRTGSHDQSLFHTNADAEHLSGSELTSQQKRTLLIEAYNHYLKSKGQAPQPRYIEDELELTFSTEEDAQQFFSQNVSLGPFEVRTTQQAMFFSCPRQGSEVQRTARSRADRTSSSEEKQEYNPPSPK